jgi:hypothetical protein
MRTATRHHRWTQCTGNLHFSAIRTVPVLAVTRRTAGASSRSHAGSVWHRLQWITPSPVAPAILDGAKRLFDDLGFVQQTHQETGERQYFKSPPCIIAIQETVRPIAPRKSEWYASCSAAKYQKWFVRI